MSSLKLVILVIVVVCHRPGSARAKLSPLYVAPENQRVAGEWLVMLAHGDVHDVDGIVADIEETFPSMQVMHRYVFEQVKALKVRANDDDVEKLRAHPEVVQIESNVVVRLDSSDSCEKQNTGDTLWGLSRIGVRYAPPNYDTAEYGRDIDSEGQGVDVYIMDSGINLAHKDFEGRAVFGMTSSEVALEGDDDLNGHGTHVAGTVGGKTYGVAKKAQLISVKVLDREGNGTVTSALEGLIWACEDFAKQAQQNGGKKRKGLLNASLGIKSSFDLNANIATGFISACVDKGLTLVVAAGNDQSDACDAFPAMVSSVITVASSNKTDDISSFSNHGACVDIVAPGHEIKSTWIGSDTATNSISGTSMAAPHVAGVAARYLSEINHDVTPHQIKGFLLSSSSLGRLNVTGKNYISAGTPNRLLYAPCRLTPRAVEPVEPGTRDSEVLIYIMFPMVLLVFIVVMVKTVQLIAPWLKDKMADTDTPSVPYTDRSTELSGRA